MPPSPKLVVIGQGYVGLPLSMLAVRRGCKVVGLDTDAARIAGLREGRSYVEDISTEELSTALASGRYTPSTDYADAAGFDVAVITVPTPLREGLPDLTFVEDSGRQLGAHITPDALVVLESTTYPGTTEELLQPILEEVSGLKAGVDFHLGYSPERIDPGNPKYGLQNTPKVVAGIDVASGDRVEEFYGSLIDTTVRVADCKVAELTKLLENTFRHVNIALVNELAIFAHDLGIDVWEAIDASSTKPFGFMRFTPGPGVGGHCLPIDPSYLSWDVKRRLGSPFRFVELANDINDHMPQYVIQRVTELLNSRRKAVNGSRILLLGLAYKKNTADARESPATKVAELLVARGAEVRAVDAHVLRAPVPDAVERVELTAEEVTSADVVVLLTEHDDVDYDLLADASLVLDTRRRLTARSNVVSL